MFLDKAISLIFLTFEPAHRIFIQQARVLSVCQCLLYLQVSIHSPCINNYFFLSLGSVHLLLWTFPLLCFLHLVPAHSLLSVSSSFPTLALCSSRTSPSGNSFFSKLSIPLHCLISTPTADLVKTQSLLFPRDILNWCSIT